jgi:hypothetical protein
MAFSDKRKNFRRLQSSDDVDDVAYCNRVLARDLRYGIPVRTEVFPQSRGHKPKRTC